MLSAERVVLNFLQRLCGISTMTLEIRQCRPRHQSENL
jgi:nicotinate-nucleotide pyrophosphorylase